MAMGITTTERGDCELWGKELPPVANVQRITSIDASVLRSLIVGYTTSEVYEISRVETDETVRFELRLISLGRPLVKRYEPLDQATVEDYLALPAKGHSFVVFENGAYIGLALGEVVAWNGSLWVREFHVAESARGQGIGRALMDAVVADARASGLRCVVCESQSTNVPAIRFYRAMGFTLEGVDLSYYSNRDRERGEVAVFMKRMLDSDVPV